MENANSSDDSKYEDHRERLDRSRDLTRDESVGTPRKHWSSRVLHRIGRVSEHAAAGSIAAGAVFAWVVFGIVAGFP
ncbi:hypothetical protein [Glaciihabitans sp. UYNi722]|uniref:hypothetical protein n=1 Tax=Glaciihabitans sp. UYNi722 TaxID=3156344 RepID=UPI003391997B